MPSAPDLRALREHIAAHHLRLHRAASASAFRNVVGELQGERLTRVPRGYATDHKAAHYLRYKQFLAGKEYDANFATSDRFYPELLRIFRAVHPIIRFLNDGLRPTTASAPAARRYS
jgi:uncharacterized protein (DUF2461 family)